MFHVSNPVTMMVKWYDVGVKWYDVGVKWYNVGVKWYDVGEWGQLFIPAWTTIT